MTNETIDGKDPLICGANIPPSCKHETITNPFAIFSGTV